jgi:hypothetical protein
MAKTKLSTRQLKINARDSVRLVTDANIADIAAGAPDTVDSVTVVAGDRILVNAQTSSVDNGVYQVDTVGTGANGAWTRVVDMDEDAEIRFGDVIHAVEGTLYARTSWYQTDADPIAVDTDANDWSQNTDAGLTAANYIWSETPTGAVDGANVTFTLANTPTVSKVGVYLNGQRLVEGATEDFTISGAVITLADAPKASPGNPDVVKVDYLF